MYTNNKTNINNKPIYIMKKQIKIKTRNNNKKKIISNKQKKTYIHRKTNTINKRDNMHKTKQTHIKNMI